MQNRSIWLGWDFREVAAVSVAQHSIERHLSQPIPVRMVRLESLRALHWYWRETARVHGRLFDVISEHPMATEFAISRFLTPHLHKHSFGDKGWALFMDGDILVREDMTKLFDQLDDHYAVMCVKHNHVPTDTIKMDNQVQSVYARKNWSSVMAFNVGHPANEALTIELINTVPGRDLHRFCWLNDALIGGLDVSWNWLVGVSKPIEHPNVVHFTEGWPGLSDKYADVQYADEWWQEYEDCQRVPAQAV